MVLGVFARICHLLAMMVGENSGERLRIALAGRVRDSCGISQISLPARPKSGVLEAMRSESKYQERAEQCIARAKAVVDPADRARWLQLAEQWALLSRLPFQTASATRHQPTGLWRGHDAWVESDGYGDTESKPRDLHLA